LVFRPFTPRRDHRPRCPARARVSRAKSASRSRQRDGQGSRPHRAGTPAFSFPADLTELVAELDQHPDDYPVSKQRLGAFIGTSLHDYLRQRGVTQIFLTGIASSSGVESTARSAYDYGYNFVLVVDAMTDRDADAHRHSVEKTFPRLGQTDTTDNVLKVLRG